MQLALAYCLPLESVTNDLCSLPLHTASYDNQLQMTSADYPCIKPSITTSNRWLLQLTLAYCFPSQSVTYDLNSLPLHAASHQNQQQMACAAYPCILPPVKQTLSEQLIPTYCLQWKSPTPNMHLLFFFYYCLQCKSPTPNPPNLLILTYCLPSNSGKASPRLLNLAPYPLNSTPASFLISPTPKEMEPLTMESFMTYHTLDGAFT